MRSFPFNAVITGMSEEGYPILDRVFGAEDWRDVVKRLISNGIFMDSDESFQATAGDNMTVIFTGGTCLIEGTIGTEKNVREMAFQAADTQDRIDTVVLRFNDNRDVRSIDYYVKTGSSSDTPIRPELTRTDTVWELGLCDVYIPANSSSISQSRITDTRLETSRCGLCLPFATVDTTGLYDQIQAAITDKIAEIDAFEDLTYLKGGFYAVEAKDNHLLAYYDDEDNPPPLYIENGHLFYQVNEDNVLDIGEVGGSAGTAKFPAGFIFAYGSEDVPDGFLMCNGGAVPRAEYPELFAAIGTAFGKGNGSTTFTLPNLKNKFLRGIDIFGGTYIGETGGEAAHTLTVEEMPNHRHNLKLQGGSIQESSSFISWQSGSNYQLYGSATETVGGGAAHNNLPPYVTINYIISTGK